jgi:hypothetical protein
MFKHVIESKDQIWGLRLVTEDPDCKSTVIVNRVNRIGLHMRDGITR